jgi:hypothetical protein
MIEVYHKEYHNKVVKEVTYYFNINSRGYKKYYEVIYELIADIDYYYSKYFVEIDGKIENTEKIKNEIIKYTPILFENIREKRRLSVLAKFILYLIAINNSTSIYKIVKEVKYHNNGNEIHLSSNAFIKSAYKLLPLFEKIYK